MNVFVISDTHFNHLKMLEYENRPKNFNEIIIRKWNKQVKPEDVVFHLGDVILGKNSELEGILSQLNGKKILCRGNHDHESASWYMNKGFDFVCDYFILDDIAFSHAPLTPLPFQTIKQHSKDKHFIKKHVRLNIHGHFHRGQHRGKEGFPDRYYDHEFFHANRRSYHLIQIEEEFRPYRLEEILEQHVSK